MTFTALAMWVGMQRKLSIISQFRNEAFGKHLWILEQNLPIDVLRIPAFLRQDLYAVLQQTCLPGSVADILDWKRCMCYCTKFSCFHSGTGISRSGFCWDTSRHYTYSR